MLDRIDRASVVRFLTGSTWDGPGGRIRFVDPTASRFSQPPQHVRTIMIRELEPTRGGVLIGIDGATYRLTACRLGRTVQTCLESSRVTTGFGGQTYGG